MGDLQDRYGRIRGGVTVGLAAALGVALGRRAVPNDGAAPLGARSEDSMIATDIASRSRREDSQLFQEFYAGEHDMGGSISPGVAKLVGDASFWKLTQSFRRDRRSGDIAK